MDRWGAWTKRAGRLAGELAQAQAGLVELTRELLAGSGWAGDGVKSPEHWLQVYAGVSAGQARALVRVAERGAGLEPVWETQSVPVAVGRSLRIVPDRTRVLVEDRDRGCRYPGCGVGGFLENHHLVHWKDGGPTDPDNLVSLCPLHHRQVHLGEYSISGDPGRVDGLVFTGGSGRVGKYIGYGMPKQPLRVLAGRPEPIRVGIRGERLDLGAVYFNSAEHPVDPEPPPPGAQPGAGPEPPAPPGTDRAPAA
ncbi:HNH endonuclease signature motif containing protein [Aestuariimicrobium sp. Y1814]|uniref:HNH endonuclease signature motif containing protein n=1 Tax=Aestuariimicrobium sp. Y1814 TaxID=3418742 RepID=UPI003DA723C9